MRQWIINNREFSEAQKQNYEKIYDFMIEEGEQKKRKSIAYFTEKEIDDMINSNTESNRIKKHTYILIKMYKNHYSNEMALELAV